MTDYVDRLITCSVCWDRYLNQYSYAKKTYSEILISCKNCLGTDRDVLPWCELGIKEEMG